MVGARSVLQPLCGRLVPGRQAPTQGRAGRVPAPQTRPGPDPLLQRHVPDRRDRRVRLPVAKGHPELWVRLARPLPYPAEQVRAVTLLADGGRLWLAVTAAVPVQHHDLDPGRVAGVDLGIIHPYAVVTAGRRAAGVGAGDPGRELPAPTRTSRLARPSAARRAPRPGQRGSRRWRRHRRPTAPGRGTPPPPRPPGPPRGRQAGRRLRRPAPDRDAWWWATPRVSPLTTAGRVHNLRLRQWRRTHLVQALRDKAERAGIQVRLVDERGTSSTCPACRRRVPKPSRPPIPLPTLQLLRAPGPGRCRQHRRQGWRRNHEREAARAGRAPPGRHRAGTT